MPVSYAHKIIFVHIPKCAGTTVENMLGIAGEDEFYSEKVTNSVLSKIPRDKFTNEEYRICASKNMQHYTIEELQKILPSEIFNNYKKIAIVRNPYDRLVSDFHFFFPNSNLSQFEDFVRSALSLDVYTRNWLYDGHLETQTSYLSGEVNVIYKYENIQSCLSYLTEITGKIPKHLRKSKNKIDWENYYTPNLRDLVYNFYSVDFKNFGYM